MPRSRSPWGLGIQPDPLILYLCHKPYGRVAVTLHWEYTRILEDKWNSWLESRARIASTREQSIRHLLGPHLNSPTYVEMELFEEDLQQLRHLLGEWDEEQFENMGRS